MYVCIYIYRERGESERGRVRRGKKQKDNKKKPNTYFIIESITKR